MLSVVLQPQRVSGCLRYLFVVVALVFGLIAAALIVVPYFVSPKLVRQRATLELQPGSPLATLPRVRRPLRITQAMSGVGCRTYRVEAGDTLSELAQRFETTAVAIALANNLYTDILKAGQSLVICGVSQVVEPEASAPEETPGGPGEPIRVVMAVTYPTHIYNRKPQWVTLAVALPQRDVGISGTGVLRDATEVTKVEPVTLPAPEAPRLPRNQTAMLVEQWLSAQLTGAGVVRRSGAMDADQPLSPLLTEANPLTWKWLFVPPAAGEYLFGLDVYSRGEFEVLDSTGDMIDVARTRSESVWSHDFAVSVDELFGIPRQWFVVASALGALFNLVLSLFQILRII